VPPVRDEESETQRKAHAKRVRETRRSTQGVTLEDLKSAEQLVKKKQQQENMQRTSELQQLVAASSSSSSSVGSSNVGTTSADVKPTTTTGADRRPSWRMKTTSADDKGRVSDFSPSYGATAVPVRDERH